MACKRLATLFLAVSAIVSARQERNLRVKHAGDSLVRSLEFSHRLRVCNAYPYAAALDVYRDDAEKLTSEKPMPYKSCRDLAASLKAGDKLNFKVGDVSAGSFSVADLPENDATLLLVIHRHDTVSTAVAFESHVFSNLGNAQVAVIDTYKGSKHATPKIRDVASARLTHSKKDRSEDLRYDSVVAIGEGSYDVVLDDPDGKEVAKSSFVAVQKECYVVLRTGVEAQGGESFPEELVVFPQSDPKDLPHSGVAMVTTTFPAIVAALATMLSL